MPVAVGIGAAVGGVGSAVIGSKAAKSAANTQAEAANQAAQAQLQASREAAQLQLGMFNTIRGDLSPYRDVGTAALPAYYALLGLTPPPSSAGQGIVMPGGNTINMVQTASGQWVDPASYYGPKGAPTMKVGDINYSQVLKDRPDVLAQYNRILPTIDWNSPWAAEHGFTQEGGPEDFAKYWLSAFGQPSGYSAPTWTQEQIDSLYPKEKLSGGAPAAAPGGPVLDASAIQKYLENTPGYQFTRDQGMQAVRNALGAKGLSGSENNLSGAFGKGIARFVTGLADTTYGNQLERIRQAVGGGQSAANQTGAYGSTAASGAAGNLTAGGNAIASGITGAANASAAGQIGAANAITGGISSAINGGLGAYALSMYGRPGSTPTPPVSTPPFSR